MRRRHPDERCGLCEAAPCRPCIVALPEASIFISLMRPTMGGLHFQPVGFVAELPVEAQAKSSGALGTPERNHSCERCAGSGVFTSPIYGRIACGRCWGTGEINARGRAPRRCDLSLRRRVTAARDFKLIGRRK